MQQLPFRLFRRPHLKETSWSLWTDGLYGVDWHHAANIDVMIGGVEDLKAKWKARFYGKDKTAEDIAAALPLWLEDVQPWLGHLEKLKSRHGGKWM